MGSLKINDSTSERQEATPEVDRDMGSRFRERRMTTAVVSRRNARAWS